MVAWTLVYAKQALKDAKRISAADLKHHVVELLEILKKNPYQSPPPYKNW